MLTHAHTFGNPANGAAPRDTPPPSGVGGVAERGARVLEELDAAAAAVAAAAAAPALSQPSPTPPARKRARQ